MESYLRKIATASKDYIFLEQKMKELLKARLEEGDSHVREDLSFVFFLVLSLSVCLSVSVSISVSLCLYYSVCVSFFLSVFHCLSCILYIYMYFFLPASRSITVAY